MAHHLAVLFIACALAVVAMVRGGQTVVSANNNNQFMINGKTTNQGSPAAGLLLNSRMTQAIFDDENSATVAQWRYPDTNTWNATRNTLEFVSNVSTFAAKGLNAVSVGLQGSNPDPTGQNNQQAVVTGFNNDGSLNTSWVTRLMEVIKTTDSQGMVVILNLFDLSQEGRLNGLDATIFSAVQHVVALLVTQGVTNVILDLADACNPSYTHQMLTPNNINQLIKYVRVVAPKLLVSTSFPPGVLPPDSVIDASNVILLHATGLNRTGLHDMVSNLRSLNSYRNNPSTILVNQDSADIDNLAQAVADGVSWGFYTQGLNNYVDGYCSPPVNWGINTIDKKTFFDEVVLLTQTK